VNGVGFKCVSKVLHHLVGQTFLSVQFCGPFIERWTGRKACPTNKKPAPNSAGLHR
jgi:hypothetical protein